MRDLLATLADVVVEIPEAEPGGEAVRFRFRAPTVSDALAVIDSAEALVAEPSMAARERLRTACEGWLPDELIAFYFREETPPNVLFEDLKQLLAAGVVGSERHAEDEKRVRDDARKRQWAEIIADYASEYHMPPAQVLQEPWPFFLLFARQVLRLRASRRVDHMIAEAAVRGGSDEIWQLQMEAAGYARPVDTSARWTPPPGWVDAKDDPAIKAFRAKHYGEEGRA